jgi:hypothetical protein
MKPKINPIVFKRNKDAVNGTILISTIAESTFFSRVPPLSSIGTYNDLFRILVLDRLPTFQVGKRITLHPASGARP